MEPKDIASLIESVLKSPLAFVVGIWFCYWVMQRVNKLVTRKELQAHMEKDAEMFGHIDKSYTEVILPKMSKIAEDVSYLRGKFDGQESEKKTTP